MFPSPTFTIVGDRTKRRVTRKTRVGCKFRLSEFPDLAPVASRSVIDRAGFSEGHLIVAAPREGRGDMVLPWRIRPLVNFHQ